MKTTSISVRAFPRSPERSINRSALIVFLALLSLAACGKDQAPKISAADLSTPIDPVCKMDVSKLKIAATTTHEGKTYGFCSPHCKVAFEKEPQKYVQK